MAVMGLFEVLFAAVSFLFLAPEEKSCSAVELHGYMENAEFLIRSALVRHQGRIYIIDCGAHPETLHIALLLARDFERITLLSADDAVLRGSPLALGENIT